MDRHQAIITSIVEYNGVTVLHVIDITRSTRLFRNFDIIVYHRSHCSLFIGNIALRRSHVHGITAIDNYRFFTNIRTTEECNRVICYSIIRSRDQVTIHALDVHIELKACLRFGLCKYFV